MLFAGDPSLFVNWDEAGSKSDTSLSVPNLSKSELQLFALSTTLFFNFTLASRYKYCIKEDEKVLNGFIPIIATVYVSYFVFLIDIHLLIIFARRINLFITSVLPERKELSSMEAKNVLDE